MTEGYSLNEIQNVENNIGSKFPTAYVEFLLLMGKQVPFLQGIDYSMYDLKGFRKGAECMLYENFDDNGLKFLKEDDLVFMSSQGSWYCFMSLSKGENPPVHLIHGGQRELKPFLTYPSFTEFINKNVGATSRHADTQHH